jgi:heme exporter protein D
VDFSNPHVGFVVASYAITAIVLAGLVGWVIGRGRNLDRRLARLEAEGAPRRRRAEGEP